MKKEEVKHKAKLSLIAALRYFLKGNMIFALNGIVLYAIDTVFQLFPPLFQQVFTDNIITHKNPEWFTPLMAIYITMFLIEVSVWIAFFILRRKNQVKIIVSSSTNYLWTVLRLPMTLVSQFSPGELVARYTTIPKTVAKIDFTLPNISAVIAPVLYCSLVMLFNWKLGALGLFSIVLLVYVMRSTTKIQKKISMDLEVTEARLQNVTMTGMSNLETIKSLGSEQYFYAQWERAYAQAMNARATTTTTSVYLGALPVVVLQLTNSVILCLGTWFILKGEMTPGMLLASQGLINSSVYPVNAAIDSMQTIMRLNSSIQRIKEVTDCGEESPALRLPEGDDLPEVLSLVSGLYEPWEGEVLFDGKPRKAIDRMTFVNSVSVVNQDVTLFEGTICDNVKMWDESIEDTTMMQACNDAQIHYEIMERPGAYQGTVAERGKNFSGGQRQRIEIATALAKEPTIFLMDEGTSALDPQTEAKVMNHLYEKGMTMIMIAHRLETIADCDQIYVIEQGHITQHGTHDELRQMDGLYSNLLKYA